MDKVRTWADEHWWPQRDHGRRPRNTPDNPRKQTMISVFVATARTKTGEEVYLAADPDREKLESMLDTAAAVSGVIGKIIARKRQSSPRPDSLTITEYVPRDRQPDDDDGFADQRRYGHLYDIDDD